MKRVAEGKPLKNDDSEQNLYRFINQEIEKYLIFKLPNQEKYFYEEIILSTWMKIWSKASQCRGKSKKEILAWAKIIAFHTGVDLIKNDQKLQCVRLETAFNESGEQTGNDDNPKNPDIYQNKQSGTRSIEDEVIFREKMRADLARLTIHEKWVLLMLMDGYSKKEIAGKMVISPPRITQYIQQIRKKLQVESESDDDP